MRPSPIELIELRRQDQRLKALKERRFEEYGFDAGTGVIIRLVVAAVIIGCVELVAILLIAGFIQGAKP